MAVTNIYDKKKPRYIKLYDTREASPPQTWLYIFLTNVPASEVSDLGQTAITDALPTDGALITQTNLPRPMRMRNPAKKISSFCGSDKIKTAKQAGWQKVKNFQFAREKAQVTTGFSETSKGGCVVYVPVKSSLTNTNTIDYAWVAPKQQLARISAAMDGLGVKFPTTAAEWAKLVFGTGGGPGNNSLGPEPPRAKKTVANGNRLSTTETYYDQTKDTLPDGWLHVQDWIPLELSA